MGAGGKKLWTSKELNDEFTKLLGEKMTFDLGNMLIQLGDIPVDFWGPHIPYKDTKFGGLLDGVEEKPEFKEMLAVLEEMRNVFQTWGATNKVKKVEQIKQLVKNVDTICNTTS